MSVYLSEEEQLDNLKRFFKKYGSGILTLMLVVAAAFAGWRYYLVQQDKAYNEGYTQYQQITQAAQKAGQNPASQGDLSSLREMVRKLSGDQPASAFTVQSLFLLAKVEAETGHAKDAAATLQKAVTAADGKGGLEEIARIRHARSLLQNQQPDPALQEINRVTDPAFIPTAQEVKGDILVAKNQLDDARKAYQTAWDESVKRDDNRPVLMLKLQSLGVPVTPPKDKIINEDGAE